MTITTTLPDFALDLGTVITHPLMDAMIKLKPSAKEYRRFSGRYTTDLILSSALLELSGEVLPGPQATLVEMLFLNCGETHGSTQPLRQIAQILELIDMRDEFIAECQAIQCLINDAREVV